MKSLFFLIFYIINILFWTPSLKAIEIYTENYPPYNYLKNNIVVGVSTEILLSAAKMAQIKFTRKNITLTSWPIAYNTVLKTPNTMIYTIAWSKEREELFTMIGPFLPSNNVLLFSLKNTNIAIDKLSDIGKYSIGAVKNDIADQILKNFKIDNSKIDNSGDLTSLLKKLKAKRIDLVAYTSIPFVNSIKKLKYSKSDFKIIYKLKEIQHYFAFNKKTHPALVKKFRAGLKKFKQTDRYKKIYDEYTFITETDL